MKTPGASDPNTGPLKDVFHQKLESLKAAPSDHVWERLEIGLDRQQLARDQSIFRTYLRLAAVFLLLLLSTGTVLTYLYLKNSDGELAKLTATNSAPAQANSAAQSNAEVKEDISVPAESELFRSKQAEAQKTATDSTTEQSPELANHQEQHEKKELKKSLPGSKETLTGKKAPILLGAVTKTRKTQPVGRVIAAAVSNSKQVAEAGNQAKKSPLAHSVSSVTLSGKANSSRSEQPENSTGSAQIIAPATARATQTIAAGSESLGNTRPSLAQASPIGEEEKADSLSAKQALAKEPLLTADSSKQSAIVMPVEDTPRKDSVTLFMANGWTVSALAGPVYFNQNIRLSPSGTVITPNILYMSAVPLYDEAAKEFDANTQSAASSQAGIMVGKAVSPRFRLEAGISYSRFAATTASSFLVTDSVLIQSIIPEPETYSLLLPTLLTAQDPLKTKTIVRTTAHEVRYEYRYLNFPLQLQFYVNKGKWRTFTGLGLQASLLLESHITSNHPQVKSTAYTENSNAFFRSWQWSVLFSGGLSYALSQQVSLQGSGQFASALSPITRMKVIEQERQKLPYTFGLNLGITYHFGKRLGVN